MCKQIQSIQCIVPPHMLQQIMVHGTIEQREHALKNMAVSAQMRIQRDVITEVLPESKAIDSLGKQRTVYDAQAGSSLPGIVVRTEGSGPTGDPAVDEAYDGAGATYDLFSEIYDRDSIDNRGMPLESTVHYKTGYDNAFWNGQRMVYGDGDEDLPADQRLFNRFTIAIDVIGHELTHGVTQFAAGLVYRDQSGALNESMSDVFGILVKQYFLRESVTESDWLIGKGIFTSAVQGTALRSMVAPGTAYDDPVLGIDPQPGHMLNYVNTNRDNGGVHINSGIPNRAFQVTSMELGGFAWEKAGKIWYATLTSKLRADSTFMDAATMTYAAAGELYGQGSLEQQAVRTGWSEVGITIEADTTPPPPTDPTPDPVDPPDPQPTPPPTPQPQPDGCLSMSTIRSILGWD